MPDDLVLRLRAESLPRACHQPHVTNMLAEAADRIEALEAENAELREAMEEIELWTQAYPLAVFPEPDFEKAHQLLMQGGITLDSISASNMRAATARVKGIIDSARRRQ